MKKIAILLTSLVSLLSFVFPKNFTIDEKNVEALNQINDKQTIEPSAVAPNNEINNENSDNLFITDYFAPYYFKNLKGRFGHNVKDTCTYIAVEMLLSYYDCFWNDDLLPEKYDGTNVFVNETVLNAVESPGSKNEADIGVNPENLSDEEYYLLVNEHRNDIPHFDLVARGIELLNRYDEENKRLYLRTFLRDVKKVINAYLDESTTLKRDAISIKYDDSNSTKMRNTIIDKVTNGIPVIVDAFGTFGDVTDAHTFIVYDYDDENDEIYCNAGYYDETLYHISMTNLGFIHIQEIMYFEPKIEHEHSFNYSRIDVDGSVANICACSAMIPTKIEIHLNYLDVSPVFAWNSIIKDKWSEKYKYHYKLRILRSDRNLAFEIDDINDNAYTLSTEEWANIINNVATPTYYASVVAYSDTGPSLDDYYCEQLFTEPNRYMFKTSFLPSDWGFEGRYYFLNELDPSHLETDPDRMYTTITRNGLTVDTERLRCGYIENSYVVLSPRRQNAGRAYFEMNFDKAVYSFMYRACMWSGSEYLDGTATIQVKNAQGVWSTLKDIPISSLKTKENGLTQFVETTSYGIYGLRFETTATATGDRNKGRLCLGDIVFGTNKTFGLLPYVDYDYAI